MIPGSSSDYTLVALVHHRTQKTATTGDLEPGGHYTSTLRHIGSKHILFYDDAANNAIIKEASAKIAAEFMMERSQRKAPTAAIYYLVVGKLPKRLSICRALIILTTFMG
jgi:hypothetical protein